MSVMNGPCMALYCLGRGAKRVRTGLVGPEGERRDEGQGNNVF